MHTDRQASSKLETRLRVGSAEAFLRLILGTRQFAQVLE